MSRLHELRPPLAAWGMILGLWLLLVLGFAAQLVYVGNLDWMQGLSISLRDWFPWAFLAPAAAWLGFRFPLERGRLGLSIPVHLLSCVAAVLICDLLGPPGPPGQGPGGGGMQRRARFGAPAHDPGPGFDRPPFPEPGPGGPERPMETRHAIFINNRARFNIPIYWVIVSISHALAFYRRSQDRERKAAELEASLAEARLEALRMQLHPHFLFNTLNAISTLVHKDPAAADEMIADLSELLRVALDASGRQEVPLREELEFLDRYLDIQRVRFGDRLRIEKEIDVAVLDAMVPTLILQPLAENAIRHGIEPGCAAGLIKIHAHRSGDRLRISITDNGGGLKPNAARQSEGIGLANTRARLTQLYGESARLVLNSGSAGGCSVELELPCRPSVPSVKAAAGTST